MTDDLPDQSRVAIIETIVSEALNRNWKQYTYSQAHSVCLQVFRDVAKICSQGRS